MRISTWRNSFISLTSVAIMLLLWCLGAILIDAEIILPPPSMVIWDFFHFFSDRMFFHNVVATIIRGICSFLFSFLFGLIIGVFAGRYVILDSAFRPFLTVIRSTPIMSIILIAIVWFHTGTVPVFAAILITFPVVVENCIIGIRETDQLLLEMAEIYGIPSYSVLVHISIPSMIPYIISGARNAIGLTWKVIVAGEVLSLPEYGVGTQLQFSQLNLETSEVFAWTVVAILLSALSQLLMSVLIYILGKRRGASGYYLK